ncbi:MAG: hypothetical protein M1461_00685, partial [Nitrospirae bacterium]|nr:hypothetical protein [Nitrospirota bacterium]
MHLAGKQAELLAHVQNTNYQYNLPEIGKRIDRKSNREGVAERFPDGSVQKSQGDRLLPYNGRENREKFDFVGYGTERHLLERPLAEIDPDSVSALGQIRWKSEVNKARCFPIADHNAIGVIPMSDFGRRDRVVSFGVIHKGNVPFDPEPKITYRREREPHCISRP